MISLSSVEAEWYGMVRAAGQGLALQGLLEDLQVVAPLLLHTDSEGARGSGRMPGFARLRHVELQTLLLQAQLSRNSFTCVRVPGCSNAADVLTKHLSGPCLDKSMAAMGCR